MKIENCCLTIAGSDSGGNAGVQADLRAFHAYGVHGCTVFTALTAQNPHGVAAVHAVQAEFVAAQLASVLGTYAIRSLKTGMLAEAPVIETVADALAPHAEIAKVFDPVMVATSGARLLADDALETLRRKLLPQATLITPNLPEAEVLAGGELTSSSRMATVERAEELARRLAGELGTAVLVKGGHGRNAEAVDVLFDGREIRHFALPWVADPVSTHGTGCSFAAAATAELARGMSVAEAVEGAKRYVYEAIRTSYWVGKDCGVLGWVDCGQTRSGVIN